jgi:hypothetical protein
MIFFFLTLAMCTLFSCDREAFWKSERLCRHFNNNGSLSHDPLSITVSADHLTCI